MSPLTDNEQNPDEDHPGLDDGSGRVTMGKGHYFMSATHNNPSFAAVVLTLSIAALPNLVNGQPQSLTSVNSDKSSNSSPLKDSVKDTKTDVAQLISAVLSAGTSEFIGTTLAPVIGLPKPMPTKDVEISINQKASVTETRRCFVVYEKPEGAEADNGEKRPVCAYILRVKRAGLDKETRYFRIDLNGKLEKAILAQGKYDSTGKVVRGSGVRFDQDINSPEVKKTFEAEMRFWLKDWLKKQQDASKKSAGVTKPKPTATNL